MTIKQAKNLTFGQVIFDSTLQNKDGTPARYKVNGKVKIWKRDLNRIQIPLKRGLYEYDYLTENNIEYFHLTEEEAKSGDKLYNPYIAE